MKRVILIRSNPVTPDPPVEKMANTLLELGYKVTILGWDRENNYRIAKKILSLSNGNCTLINFGIKANYGAGLKKNLIPLIKFQIAIINYLKSNKYQYDIIHAFDFDTGFIAAKCAKKYNKKMVYHILDYYIDAHNLGDGFLRKIIGKEENKVINFADATIICTEKRKKQIKGSDPRALYIIHNTPDSSLKFYEDKVINVVNSSKMRIAYIGILAESRMLLELCDIVSQNSNYELHIGGFGNIESKIQSYSDRFDNIYFYGKLPYEKTLKLESECDIMVAIYNPGITNNRFAAPNKFYESLMLGKPIVMAKNTGFDDIINKNDIGISIDFSVDGIKYGLNYLFNKQNNWKQMNDKSLELYDKYYSWNIMKERISALYNNLHV